MIPVEKKVLCFCFTQIANVDMPWLHGLVVLSSPPATEETGAMGREIESRQGIQI
jgi:hypothetical protein